MSSTTPGPEAARAEVKVRCGSPAAAQAVAGALQPELADGPPGCRLEATACGAEVRLAVACHDLSGLRAGLHGLVRLADAALRLPLDK